MLQISRQQARRFLLSHQGLYPAQQLVGPEGVLSFVRRMGCIQFDPLNVVGRNPDLVLQSRVRAYRPDILESLLYQERSLIDGWDKMASILPVEDYPFFAYRREAARRSERHTQEAIEQAIPAVLEALRQRGPLSSIDIKNDAVLDEWFWGPTRVARAALDTLFDRGEIIVHHRVGSRKVYDLAKRHIPAGLLSAPNPFRSDEALYDWVLLRRIRSVGMLWVGFGGALAGPGTKRKTREATLARLTKRGELVVAQVKGIKQPFYLPPDLVPQLESVDEPDDTWPVALIAPLDNLIWDRDIIEALFGFAYRWEVYTPVAKRQFGYYVLPVLWRDRLVGRCEPVREKKSGALHLKNWWWEDDVAYTPALRNAAEEGLRHFAAYLGTEEITYSDDATRALGR